MLNSLYLYFNVLFDRVAKNMMKEESLDAGQVLEPSALIVKALNRHNRKIS